MTSELVFHDPLRLPPAHPLDSWAVNPFWFVALFLMGSQELLAYLCPVAAELGVRCSRKSSTTLIKTDSVCLGTGGAQETSALDAVKWSPAP